MKRFLFITATISLFCMICGTLLFTLLPWAITASGSRFLHAINMAQGEVRLDSLSLNKAVISGFLGSETESALSFPRVEIHYSPKQIAQAKIESVQVEGAVINFDLANGQLRIRGLLPAGGSKEKVTTGVVASLPVSIGKLRFLNCRAIFHSLDKPPLSLSFNGTIHIQSADRVKGSYLIEKITLNLDTDNPLPGTLSVTIENRNKKMRVGLAARINDLNGLHRLAPQVVSGLNGRGELSAEFEISENLTGFDQLTASLSLHELHLKKDDVSINSGENAPLVIHLDGSDKKLGYSLTGLGVSTSQVAAVRLKGTIQPRLGLLDGTGTVDSPLLNGPLRLTLSGNNAPGKSTMQVSLASDKQQFPLSTGTVHTGPFSATVQIIRGPEGVSSSGRVQLERLQTDQPELDIGPAEATFIHTPEKDSKLAGITGSLTIPSISYQGEDVAETAIQFTIPTATGRLQFGGSLTGHQENPLRLLFSGSYDPINELKLTYGMENTVINNNSLPSFTTLPDGTVLSAEVSASGNFSFSRGTPKGYLQLKLQNGSVHQEEKNISIKGLATELTFDNLPKPESRKGQLLTMETIDINTIHVNKGSISYQLESDGSLFIEKSRFSWCGGKVEIGSTRISPKSKTFSTTLYCDRLQFAELLTQFGISGTDGDGSLNGRLPVEYSKDGFVFDDGFLFSTPGNNGIVRFNNTDMLQQSLPDMNQAAYLDYSIQALENFSYNWTKLTFNSIEEDLRISMQIDGKPAMPLPYGYKNGQLVRKPEGSGIQHPLRLDINFHLPFGEMFKYGQNLQKILEKM